MELIDRVELLQKADDNPQLQAVLMELCRKDPIYWFNTFCWTFDPRSDKPHIPFNLYPFQEWCIKDWYDCIEEQKDFGVEKSRDMGVTWMVMLLIHYCFLFRDGWNFLVGSRKEDYVDTASIDPSTLFGKVLYNHSRLPRWMKPKTRRKTLEFCNESNGNLITGESSNPSFGRGARQRGILMDELAFWECADAAYGGASATTNCRIVVSTPYGENNRFAELMNDPDNDYRAVPQEIINVAS